MPLNPDPPFPKSQGDNIRSKDWNDAINEVKRLDTAKLNVTGGAITGLLNISGQLGIGTPRPSNPLTIESAAGTYLNVRSTQGGGPFEVLVGVDPTGGIVSTMTNHDLQLRAGRNDNKLVIKASGNVGIGTNDPGAKLEINDGDLLFKARSEDPGDIIFQSSGGGQKGRIWSNPTAGAGLFLSSGDNNPDITIDSIGRVGIGTPSPAAKLDVSGDIRAGNSDLYFTKTDHNHTGIGNTAGFAAIENTASHNALMILGRAGTPQGRAVKLWDYLQVNGPLDVTGKLTVSGGAAVNGDANFTGRIGTFGFPATPIHAGWGGGIHTFDIEAEGTIWSRSGYLSPPQDLAENYYSDLDLAAGDVVCLDKHQDRIVPSGRANDDLVIGVISTQPGVLLNSNPDSQPPHPGWLPYPVALSGRVPCKVTDENGPIERGDLLTSSSFPRHAMKAKPIVVDGQPIYRPGTLIGKALESLASGKGMVEIFVCLR
jgi:hypothetical protein